MKKIICPRCESKFDVEEARDTFESCFCHLSYDNFSEYICQQYALCSSRYLCQGRELSMVVSCSRNKYKNSNRTNASKCK